MSKRVKKYTSAEIEDFIESFLRLKESGCTFGEIKNHLEKKLDAKFKNSEKDRSGLAHTLNRMQNKGKIRKLQKDKDHLYPRYISLNQSTFEASLDGYLTRHEFSLNLGLHGSLLEEISELQKKKNLSGDEEFILKNIYRFGFLFLHLILKSYSRAINQNEPIEKNRKMQNAWLTNALDFNNKRHSEPGIFEDRVRQHFSNPDDMIDDDGNLVKEDVNIPIQQISSLAKIMKRSFPETVETMNDTENTIDSVKEKIKTVWLEIPQEELPLREF